MNGFKMSNELVSRLMCMTAPMDEDQRKELMAAMALLCSEVQVFTHKRAFEQLRKQWSDMLHTMLTSNLR